MAIGGLLNPLWLYGDNLSFGVLFCARIPLIPKTKRDIPLVSGPCHRRLLGRKPMLFACKAVQGCRSVDCHRSLRCGKATVMMFIVVLFRLRWDQKP
jgi:hypothetical protein